LSVAARFWNISPFELEKRDDKEFWVTRAFQIQTAEGVAREIAQKAQEQRDKFNAGK
jgi:hypothetical protein